jgi:hypothetical protein
MNKMTKKEIKDVLKTFHGTRDYYVNTLYSRDVHTDGVHWLADACGAFWLIDAIQSHQMYLPVRQQDFQLWTLTVENRVATLICTNGNDNSPVLAQQVIPYTDFPLDKIQLCMVRGSIDGLHPVFILQLPSEG